MLRRIEDLLVVFTLQSVVLLNSTRVTGILKHKSLGHNFDVIKKFAHPKQYQQIETEIEAVDFQYTKK